MSGSNARYLLLDAGPSMLRGRLLPPSVPALPAKDPSETATYSIDFGVLLNGVPIVQLDYVVNGDPALMVAQASWAGTVVAIQLAGGTVTLSPSVVMTVTLVDGEQITRAVVLPIVAQSSGAAPVDPGILTLNGFPLTFGGQPLAVLLPEQPITLNQSPLTVGGDEILVGAT